VVVAWLRSWEFADFGLDGGLDGGLVSGLTSNYTVRAPVLTGHKQATAPLACRQPRSRPLTLPCVTIFSDSFLKTRFWLIPCGLDIIPRSPRCNLWIPSTSARAGRAKALHPPHPHRRPRDRRAATPVSEARDAVIKPLLGVPAARPRVWSACTSESRLARLLRQLPSLAHLPGRQMQV
jgi:hypothetical protein